jgi:hypothetical protein
VRLKGYFVQHISGAVAHSQPLDVQYDILVYRDPALRSNSRMLCSISATSSSARGFLELSTERPVRRNSELWLTQEVPRTQRVQRNSMAAA